jgi:hypothetical protein
MTARLRATRRKKAVGNMKKHKFTHTHIEHHKDGSHTVHHVHEDGDKHDVKHAAMNLDHAHDSLQDHLGSPNEGEDMDADDKALAAPGVPGAAAQMQGA